MDYWAVSCSVPLQILPVIYILQIDNPHFNHPDLYPFHSVSKPNRLLTPQLNNVTYKSTSSPLLTQLEDISPDDICDPYVQNITSDEVNLDTRVNANL